MCADCESVAAAHVARIYRASDVILLAPIWQQRQSAARSYFAGADLVSVFVAGAAVDLLVLELESEPPEDEESPDLLVEVFVDSPAEPVAELVDEPVDELADESVEALVAEPADEPDAALLPEAALSVL